MLSFRWSDGESLDLPQEPLGRVTKRLKGGGGRRRQVRLGVRGSVYRWATMSTHAEDLEQSLALPIRSGQRSDLAEEADLFGLFVNAMSALDCLVYAAYMLGAIRRSDKFALVTKKGEPRDIRLQDAALIFKREFPDHELTRQLRALWTSSSYARIRDTRNTLMHRAGISRTVTIDSFGERLTWSPNDRPNDGAVELTPAYVRAVQQITTAWMWRLACSLDTFTAEFFEANR